MEGLIDSLDQSKWQEISVAEKSGKFIEMHVNPHAHKQIDATTVAYMVESDDMTDAKKVFLEHCTKDPIKKVAVIEMRLSDDGTKITGMDLDGDVVVLK